MSVIKQSSISLNHAQMEQPGLASIISLAEGVGCLSLEQILKNRITDEWLSMFHVDGSKRKTTKCKLFECLNMTNVVLELNEYSSIVDMGMIWYLAIPNTEDREASKRDGRLFSGVIILIRLCSRHMPVIPSQPLYSWSMISMECLLSRMRSMRGVDRSHYLGVKNIPNPQMSSLPQRNSQHFCLILSARSIYKVWWRNMQFREEEINKLSTVKHWYVLTLPQTKNCLTSLSIMQKLTQCCVL